MKKIIIAARRLAILLALLGTACETNMEFSGTETASRLNIQSIAGATDPENLHAILPSESVFIWGDKNPSPVIDATFRVWKNGVEVPVEVIDDEVTGGPLPVFRTPLAAGDKLEMEGVSPTLGRVTASDVMPAPAVIRNVKVEQIEADWTYPSGNKGTDTRLLVTIADPADERNYYAIRLVHVEVWQYRWSEWDPETQTDYWKEKISTREEEY